MITKEKVIKRIEQQIAVCKGIDSDWISLTVGTGERILQLLEEYEERIAIMEEGIVRCKDCKFFIGEGHYCRIRGMGRALKPDDFCSDAERRSDDG